MKSSYRKSWAANLLMWSDLTLDPSFKVILFHRIITLLQWENVFYGFGILITKSAQIGTCQFQFIKIFICA